MTITIVWRRKHYTPWPPVNLGSNPESLIERFCVWGVPPLCQWYSYPPFLLTKRSGIQTTAQAR